jgi:uncharacterized protein
MNRIKLLIFFLTVIMINPVSAQDQNKITLPGSWLGKLSVQGIQLRLVFNFKLNEKDSLNASLDSPDQGAKDIPLGEIIVAGKKITVKAPKLSGEYNGTLTGDSTIDGVWTQKGINYTVNLKKLKSPFYVNRPQEPKPPFPYISKDVSFTNEKFNIKLAGTLTMPDGPGPFKAVILITGSGAQNRNEELMGHKPFLVIADYLSRNGIAVLRYDDRGVGGSQGKYSEATSADLATDAEAAYNFLRNNPKIDQSKIGFAGHSEGGLIAAMAAAANPSVGFIVSLAGTGVPGEEIILRQTADISRKSGVKESDIKESAETNKKVYEILKKEKDNKKAESQIVELFIKTQEKKKIPKEETEKAVNQLRMTFGAEQYTWYRYFIMTNPAIFWKKVKCPVLALNGDKDLQVAADENLPAIAKALKKNKSAKTILLPGLNHLFQHCKTGLPAEYNTIEETFSPEALKIISDWILAL